MSTSGPVITGYIVKASVEGKAVPQIISGKFASQSAAQDYAELAKKNGYKDAAVSSIEGWEKNPNEAPKKRAVTMPPVAK